MNETHTDESILISRANCLVFILPVVGHSDSNEIIPVWCHNEIIQQELNEIVGFDEFSFEVLSEVGVKG